MPSLIVHKKDKKGPYMTLKSITTEEAKRRKLKSVYDIEPRIYTPEAMNIYIPEQNNLVEKPEL